MRRVRRCALTIAAAGLPALHSAAASSLSLAEPIQLTYDAPPGCPAKGWFVDDVLGRTDRVRLAMENEASRKFAVTVMRDGPVVRGSLLIVSLDGAVTRREVGGSACGEVVSALALITALAIDPRASATPAAHPPTPASASPTVTASAEPPDASLPPSAPPSSGSSESPAPPPPPPRAVPVPAATHDEPGPAGSRTSSRGARPMRWSVGLDGETLLGVVPQVAVGAAPFVQLADTGPGVFAPAFRLSGLAATASTSFSSLAGADLEWWLLRAEACPTRFGMGATVALRLCGLLDGGVLVSNGIGLPSVQSVSRRWFAAGALARLAWSLLGRWQLEVGGGLTLPFDRYTFFYTPNGSSTPVTSVSQIPVAGGMVALGMAYRLP